MERFGKRCRRIRTNLFDLFNTTSGLSEVSHSEIWGFFAGKSQIIAVISPEGISPRACKAWCD